MTTLLAAIGALLLIPAAQAFAENTLTVKLAGTGSGKVTSVGGPTKIYPGEFEGEPPIDCNMPAPGSGTCVSTMANQGSAEEEELAEAEILAIGLKAIPGPGSEFVGWTVEEGNDISVLNYGCSREGPGVNDEPDECFMYGVEGGDAKVTATFASTGPSGPELTVVKEGTGSGTVVSNPSGISCGGTCKASFETNQKVTLTASPSAGSTFVSWKGCEKGGVNGRQCTVTMDVAKTVSAKFLTAYDVTVNRVGTGLGKVSSSPGGVLCLSNCASTTAAFKEGTSVTLTAAPTKNYVFTEWTGDCSGSSTTCSLGTLGANKTVGAKFTEVAKHNLTVTKSGGGNGTVKAAQAGINCGATCSSMAAAYYQGTVVELSATPGKGSAFGGWSGSGCSGTGTCTVTMSAAKSVTAEFK